MRKALTAAAAIITLGSITGAGTAAAHVDTYKPAIGLDNGYLPCNLHKRGTGPRTSDNPK
ncbi:hypothetical protein KO481_25365 [Nocardia sp. NEAU-G5]|uniref:Uncharacterized protein n=1 Tax=Nocardia albiluteola TaxID=2842303 RepID=A0ABS6B508_9NOCA|nr:hypothetical protein [Nocardia albiluteola]MBU3064845.1 hypothetical protein [Nocardia albiluteola]